MTDDLASLPFLTDAAAPPTANGGASRRCRRHEWGDGQLTIAGTNRACLRCGAIRDEAKSRTNRNNRKRGNRTSHDLAAYLGGRDVEPLKLPWDVEARGCRIQSKRLADRPSRAAIEGLLDYIRRHGGAELPAYFDIRPAQRLTSGRIFVTYRDWVAWHGWPMPTGADLLTSGEALLVLPLPIFRDLHVGLS